MQRFVTQLGIGLTVLWLLTQIGRAHPELDVPDAAEREITRRGSLVERVGAQQTDEAQQLIADALKPPPDDSHKWFISVVTTPNCDACKRLKQAFAESSHLKPFVDTSDQAKSWAHYNTFNIEDETQKWRFEAIKFGGFPTLLVQPPRNERYGDPKTIVLQRTGFNGDAKRLADDIRNAITAYLRSIAKEKRTTWNVHHPHNPDALGISQAPAGQDPPFAVPPRVQPTPLLPLLHPFDVPPPPEPAPNPSKSTPSLTDAGSILVSVFGNLAGSGGLTNLLLVVLAALAAVRTFRKAAGQPLLLDDVSFQRLSDVFSGLTNSRKPPAPQP